MSVTTRVPRKFQNRAVFVVEESHDGGMFISFYDASGKEIAAGGAGESTEFRWDK